MLLEIPRATPIESRSLFTSIGERIAKQRARLCPFDTERRRSSIARMTRSTSPPGVEMRSGRLRRVDAKVVLAVNHGTAREAENGTIGSRTFSGSARARLSIDGVVNRSRAVNQRPARPSPDRTPNRPRGRPAAGPGPSRLVRRDAGRVSAPEAIRAGFVPGRLVKRLRIMSTDLIVGLNAPEAIDAILRDKYYVAQDPIDFDHLVRRR